ncbi:dihydroneopterin aldolase [Legionella israelensis]|uniref:7,8-dihydroneopterin aldolase n=1 Tax=Legionella israelensis TaxID=454 RepID=A0AAX1EES2_9GAMM|nr:dihydroneopterin aldolase [Legionella israelensis]QBR83611.1 dihydroneopterin aldolase [Legionella israelensis]
MDHLEITGLSVTTCIGVYTWEQRISQRLLIDIKIPANYKNCKDAITDMLDYSEICKQVMEFVQSRTFQLIETVANEVARLIKENFKVNEVTVSVSKPHAVKCAMNVKVTVAR